MTGQLKRFLATEGIVLASSKTLLAISGGVDSVVLGHLFHELGWDFAVGHCNFNLRGQDSLDDAVFVKKLAESWGVPFFSARFETAEFATRHQVSIQVAARNLRYDWLEETRQTAGCQFIATAHHLDDSVETLLYNFTKGCGLRGLHGILPQNGKLVRPLLFATKRQILQFAEDQELLFREDASNLTDKYSRNQIRHHVIPALEAINPAFQKTAGENIGRLREAERLYLFAVQHFIEKATQIAGSETRLHIPTICSSPAPASVLYEAVKPFGFNTAQAAQILEAAAGGPGKQFFTATHVLLVDREWFIISLTENFNGVNFFIQIVDTPVQLPTGELHLEVLAEMPPTIANDRHTAYFDLTKLKFPLCLRHWQPGDRFQPLGMGGRHQKLQDFFNNEKLSRLEKGRTWILESGGAIVWVVGMRADERFKLEPNTKKVVKCSFLHHPARAS